MKNLGISIFKIVSILLVFSFLACEKEKEVNKIVNDVVETNGLIVNSDTIVRIISAASIVEKQILDTVEYNGTKIPMYEIQINGDKEGQIKEGVVIVDKQNKGEILLVVELENSLKSDSFKAKVAKVTLDFLFNYESATLSLIGNNNRTKSESTISEKLIGAITSTIDIEEKENILGITKTYSNGLLNLKIPDKKFGLKAKKDGNNTSASVSISFKDAFIKLNPSLDFFMEYNPRYLKPTENKFVNFLSNIGSPTLFAGKSAITMGTLKQFKAISYIDFDYGMTFKLEFEGKVEQSVYDLDLYKFIIPHFETVVPIVDGTELSLEVDLSVAGKLNTTYEYKKENNIVVGIDINNRVDENGVFDPSVKVIKEFKEFDGSKLTMVAKIELSAGVSLVLKKKLTVAGLVGPTFKCSAELEAALSIWKSNQTEYPGWDLSVDFGVNVGASVDFTLFHFDGYEFSAFASEPYNLFSANIYNTPNKLQLVSGNNQKGTVNTILPEKISVSVHDNFDFKLGSLFLPTVVYFESEDGKFKESAIAEDGIANIDWPLSEKAGEQKLYASLRNEKDEIIGDVVEITATATELKNPKDFSLTCPANNSKEIELNSLLKWNASESNNGGDISYDIYFGTEKNLLEKLSTDQKELEFITGKLKNSTVYYWKVVAKDSRGSKTVSEIWSFTTKSETVVELPTLTTTSVSNITETNAICGGNITNNGGATITACGVCWSTNQNPTIADNHTIDGTDNGVFTSSLTSLTANGTYYVRAYATNSEGTAYGEEVRFETNADIPDAVIVSVTPNNVILGKETLFTVTGTNLTEDLLYHIEDLENKQFVSLNSDKTEFKFKGLPDNFKGIKNGVIKLANGTSLFEFTVEFYDNTVAFGSVTDIDGNVYKTVKIGNQEWMAENLKVTHYADGREIKVVTEDSEWEKLGANNTDDAMCYYKYNENNEKDAYGALYTWAAAMGDNASGSDNSPSGVTGVCPTGWHLPSVTEWSELVSHLIQTGHNYDGTKEGNKIGKSLAAKYGWKDAWEEGDVGNNQSSNNSSGFSALPGGFFPYAKNTRTFEDKGSYGYWWSSSEKRSSDAYYFYLFRNYHYLAQSNVFYGNKSHGISVRCVKD